VGYIATPARWLDALNGWLLATQTTTSPLSSWLMAHWITEGLVDAIAQSVRLEARRRNQLARPMLGPWLAPMHGDALHAWLPMETARAREIVLAASQSGITLAPPDAFMADPNLSMSGLRVCFGGLNDSELEVSLTRLQELIAGTGSSQVDMVGIV